MMGGLARGDLFIEGWFAPDVCLPYKMRTGAARLGVTLDTLARMITRRTEPHVKLHWGRACRASVEAEHAPEQAEVVAAEPVRQRLRARRRARASRSWKRRRNITSRGSARSKTSQPRAGSRGRTRSLRRACRARSRRPRVRPGPRPRARCRAVATTLQSAAETAAGEHGLRKVRQPRRPGASPSDSRRRRASRCRRPPAAAQDHALLAHQAHQRPMAMRGEAAQQHGVLLQAVLHPPQCSAHAGAAARVLERAGCRWGYRRRRHRPQHGSERAPTVAASSGSSLPVINSRSLSAPPCACSSSHSSSSARGTTTCRPRGRRGFRGCWRVRRASSR